MYEWSRLVKVKVFKNGLMVFSNPTVSRSFWAHNPKWTFYEFKKKKKKRQVIALIKILLVTSAWVTDLFPLVLCHLYKQCSVLASGIEID